MDEGIGFTPSNARIDEIGKKAQDLIERINQSRTMDQKLMNSFEEKLMKKVLAVTVHRKCVKEHSEKASTCLMLRIEIILLASGEYDLL